MNFNFGEVLSRAGQITWKYKILWLVGIVISLIGFLAVPLSLAFNPSFSSFADPSELNRAMPSFLLMNGLIVLLSISSVPIYVIGMAIPSLATFQLENGKERLSFGELLREVLPYFWRLLGVVLVIWGGMFLVLMVISACIAFLSVLTLGFGSLCAFPLFILFIPLGILVYAVMEQAMSGVVADNLGFSSAMQRAWELVKKNLIVMALMSLIIYLGSMIIGMIISVPLIIPVFGFIFNMGTKPDIESFNRVFHNMAWWMLAFSPFYAVFQGILLSFMQSAWTLTYLRLTNPQANAPLVVEANA